MDGFEYFCVVNEVTLSAQYENETSIVCTVGSGNVSGDKDILKQGGGWAGGDLLWHKYIY